MANLIPERPRYRRERLIVGYPLLAVFALLFLSHLLFERFSLPNTYWLKLLPITVTLLLPTLAFWSMRGSGYTRALRLRAPRATQIPFLIASFFALLSGCMLLSLPFDGTSSLGNSATAFEGAGADGIFNTVMAVLILAVLPAVLEELFFRGIVVTEYERRGAVRGVLMSALLFALCHFDPRNLLVYAFSGVLFALVLYATDSLIATILLHICYNVFSLFGQSYLNALYHITGGKALFLFSLIVVLLLSLSIFFGTGARIYRLREQSGRRNPRRDVPGNVQLYTTLDALCDPPILICLILSVVGFIVL